ncbi:unnamed protein product [Calypogeia fissa]
MRYSSNLSLELSAAGIQLANNMFNNNNNNGSKGTGGRESYSQVAGPHSDLPSNQPTYSAPGQSGLQHNLQSSIYMCMQSSSHACDAMQACSSQVLVQNAASQVRRLPDAIYMIGPFTQFNPIQAKSLEAKLAREA